MALPNEQTPFFLKAKDVHRLCLGRREMPHREALVSRASSVPWAPALHVPTRVDTGVRGQLGLMGRAPRGSMSTANPSLS